jgi:pyruvate kinase
VASGKDINEARDVLGKDGSDIKIIAKIDSIYGVENFIDILN